MTNSSSIRQSAIQLRSQGLAFRDISKKLGIPLSTTHLWTKDISLSEDQKRQIEVKHKKAFDEGRLVAHDCKRKRYQEKRLSENNHGAQIIGDLSARDDLILGVALYWGEGFKKDSQFGFANSDPKMVVFMLNWLKLVFHVQSSDIKLRLGVNSSFESSVGLIEQKWSNLTGIPLAQFQKPFFQKVKQLKIYNNADSYLGVLRIRVNDHPEILPTIMGMLDKVKSHDYLTKMDKSSW